jgi:hypothetical protein
MNLTRARRLLATGLILPILFGSFLLALGQLVPLRLTQPISDVTVVASAEEWVGQSFVAHVPGLARISVRPADGQLSDDQVVVLHLRQDLASTTDILTLQAAVKDLREAGWLRFTFTPLTYQPPHKYLFILEVRGVDTLQLQAAQQDLYPEGEMIGGSGDLAFEVAFHAGAIPTLMALYARLPENKPGILGQGWVYPTLLAACFAAFLGTCVALAGETRRSCGKAATNPERRS